MFNTDITIIVIMLNSLTFFAVGYWVAWKVYRPHLLHDKNYDDLVSIGGMARTTYEKSPNVSETPVGTPPNCPADGIRSNSRFPIVDEPSGVVMRPTAAELKIMNEDEITKENKAAVAEAIKMGGKGISN